MEKPKTIIKPILKWAGGKSQMLDDLFPLIPNSFNRYIEPFIGGGALFFALQPKDGIIADSNPELINLYVQVANNVDDVISYLKEYKNDEEFFYKIRSLNWQKLDPAEAAARMIYLNKTCFNGLYRVNRNGEFNVPFGRYKNPNICDSESLIKASELLKSTKIVCGDYKDVLAHNAGKGDFVFLDPPYVPVSEYADFKRYTKEQFYEKDQRCLAKEVDRLVKNGTNVILTNSNAPLVHELYDKYPLTIVKTKRYISSKSSTRTGEDVIVKAFASSLNDEINNQISKYPPTRYMGSKAKLLDDIWNQVSRFNIRSAIDLFSGSGIVGYMFKAHGLSVISNDHMYMSYAFAKSMIENSNTILSDKDIKSLLKDNINNDHFVQDNFSGLYFSDEDNILIDNIRANISELKNTNKKWIATSALIRACLKKRPRGVFTYVGLGKYNDGRRDLKLSFSDQFVSACKNINDAVFDNGEKNKARRSDALLLRDKADLVYMDPPYYSDFSDNHYVRRYHFVEGIARNWKGVEIQKDTQTKKFKNYDSPFSTKQGAEKAFDMLFKKYSDSVIIVSYSSNCYPTQEIMISMLSKYKNHVDVIPIDYTYSFGNQADASTNRNHVQEYLFVGYNDNEVK